MVREDQSSSVSIQWVNGIIETAKRKGIGQETLFAKANVPIQWDSPSVDESRISLDDTVRIWRAAAELTNDPHFGLAVGECARPNNINVVAYLVMSSPTLREALEKVKKFRRLISDGGYVDYIPKPKESWVIYKANEASLEFSYHQIEAVLVVIFRFANLTSQGDWTPVRVMFEHQACSDSKVHERIFGCPVIFGAEANAIVFDDVLLDQPLLQASEELGRMHEGYAEQLLAKLDKQTWSKKVATLLEQSLARGPISRDIIASHMALSERSLQRKLKEEGTSFQEILDEVRLSLAERYLKDAELSLQDIATLLGFSEVSTFHRAFKRWTGRSPRQLAS